METSIKLSFISRERSFYTTLIGLLWFVALQNILGYTVNMADNIMLGRYGQDALSGAATVNQIFFLIQQFGVSVANTLVALAAQYWGEKRLSPIRTLTGYALKLSIFVSVILLIIGLFFPRQICGIFTTEEAIIEQGCRYMQIVIWSFALYCVSITLTAALRAVGVVRISFYISVVSLIVNCSINYVLIFGRFGLPELGVRGAAIGTLTARVIEFIILIIYCKREHVLSLFDHLTEVTAKNKNLRKDFFRIYGPICCATVVWALSIPLQTAILGRLSSDALAANSVASTFYQYAKVITMAMSSCSSVMIGKAIGEGRRELVKQYGRTLSLLSIILGCILGLLLVLLRSPLLGLYRLNDNAMKLAGELILLQALIMVGMSYQMPVSMGIIQGGGDAKFTMKMNLISTWLIVVPLTFLGAYYWRVAIVPLVLIIQSDQLFKCIPVWFKFRRYTWIKKLTRDECES